MSTRQLPLLLLPAWTPVPSDVDGYVVNVTSNIHTMTQQVKGGSHNEMTMKSLITVISYNVTVGIYQNILGPTTSAISVQMFSCI